MTGSSDHSKHADQAKVGSPEVERELEDLKTSLHRLQDAVSPAAHATREAFDATRAAAHQVRDAWHEVKDTVAIRRRIEEKPIAALGVAAALGFLFGSRQSRGMPVLSKATGALASIVFMRLADSAVNYATVRLLKEHDVEAQSTLSAGTRANGEFIH